MGDRVIAQKSKCKTCIDPQKNVIGRSGKPETVAQKDLGRDRPLCDCPCDRVGDRVDHPDHILNTSLQKCNTSTNAIPGIYVNLDLKHNGSKSDFKQGQRVTYKGQHYKIIKITPIHCELEGNEGSISIPYQQLLEGEQ